MGFWVAITRNGLRSGRVVTADGHGVLLHRFEQRRLGLGRGAVHFVGQHDARKDRPRPELEPLASGLVLGEHLGAHDVCRHQIGRELDTPEGQTDHLGQRPQQQRLGQTGYAFEQYVTLGEQTHQQLADQFFLTDDDLAQLGLDGARHRQIGVGVHRGGPVAIAGRCGSLRSNGHGVSRSSPLGRFASLMVFPALRRSGDSLRSWCFPLFAARAIRFAHGERGHDARRHRFAQVDRVGSARSDEYRFTQVDHRFRRAVGWAAAGERQP